MTSADVLDGVTELTEGSADFCGDAWEQDAWQFDPGFDPGLRCTIRVAHLYAIETTDATAGLELADRFLENNDLIGDATLTQSRVEVDFDGSTESYVDVEADRFIGTASFAPVERTREKLPDSVALLPGSDSTGTVSSAGTALDERVDALRSTTASFLLTVDLALEYYNSKVDPTPETATRPSPVCFGEGLACTGG